MSEWYYADADRQTKGPLAPEELARKFHQGLLRLDTLVWREGMGEWQSLRTFSDELALHQSPVETFYTPIDIAPAAAVARTASINSPYAPPTAPLRASSTAVLGGEIVYAGFWKRVAANFIDSVVIGVVGGIIGAILGAIIGAAFGLNGGLGGSGFVVIQVITNLVSLVLTAGYYAWFHASINQATLGKMAVGIKVVRPDGESISLARGIGRYFAFLLSALILGIGLIMAAFTERKQGLHDIICDTLVVDKWAFTDHPEWQKPGLGTVTIVILAIYGVLVAIMLAVLALVIGVAASAGSWN